jgi:hypothetical protein
MICLRMQFHETNFNESLIIAIIPKAKYGSNVSTILSYILQK